MDKKTVRDIDVTEKRVLVRCDFNVPLDVEDKSVITNDKRIVESLPTIKYLIKNNAKIILCSHIGKHKDKLSLAPVAKRLEELLNKDVPLLESITDDATKNVVSKMKPGDIVLLENTRLYKEEEENDEGFAKSLASLAEVFVNDAFGTAHRAHASTEGVTKYLPSVSGFLIEKELSLLGDAINNPKRPLVAIVGGAKVSSKISVLTSLLDKVDTLLIGGGMVFTFMKAQGGKIGLSICEEEKLDEALKILELAKEKHVELILAKDTVVADEFSNDAKTMVVESSNIPDNYMGMDIGEKTRALFKEKILNAGTVVLNGPMGVTEFNNFAKGTFEVVSGMAESNAVTIVGGGDSVAAVEKMGLDKKMTHVSTGGGASLEFMEGKTLPGIAALLDK